MASLENAPCNPLEWSCSLWLCSKSASVDGVFAAPDGSLLGIPKSGLSIHSRPSLKPRSIAFSWIIKTWWVRIVFRTPAESPRRISTTGSELILVWRIEDNRNGNEMSAVF